MNWGRLRQNCVCVGTAVLLAVLAAPALLAQQNADSKIDGGLLSTLTANPTGTARFLVMFQEGASLQGPVQIPDRAQRGRAVVQALRATANSTQAGVRAFLQSRGLEFSPFGVQNTIFVPNGNLGLARALAQRPEVAAVVPEPLLAIPPVTAEEGGGRRYRQSNGALPKSELLRFGRPPKVRGLWSRISIPACGTRTLPW